MSAVYPFDSTGHGHLPHYSLDTPPRGSFVRHHGEGPLVPQEDRMGNRPEPLVTRNETSGVATFMVKDGNSGLNHLDVSVIQN
ncbi:hypothetical protein AAF712_014612 [Marasmius tenuissimus]|uniref:Uncharacterized protein n=1 Tax=Marasmius tenuissimus TaxID=585030 RepID=A0ABR2ZAM6_9AGAR